MREKIAKVYMTPIEDWATGQYTVEKVAYMCADQILTLIREEIEKSLLTDKEIGEVLDYATPRLKPNERIIASLNDFKGVAQAQLHKILKALET